MNLLPASVKVAYVDPLKLIREAVGNSLNALPYVDLLVIAASGEDLNKQLLSLEINVDLCILEIAMPGINGYETVKFLRSRFPNLKFLILTSINNEFSITRMIRLGVNGYLLKSDDLSNLSRAIGEIFVNGYYYSDVANRKFFNAVKNGSHFDLSDRELTFLALCCSKLTFEEMGRILHVSKRTVEHYQQRISDKLELRSRTELALFAVATGIIT
jgi:DNA-binding NarL/FixJ family response regulator